ncbi:MAG TPA: lipoate--protein ligase family protein [Gemmatimonadales bacterium]|nr:lipoate--protein ligase family protein [Gemmatimonadales bacterium]
MPGLPDLEAGTHAGLRAGASATRPPLSWSLLLSPPLPGWANMALDLALLEHAERTGHGIVRLYRWDPFALSFGRHEPALRRYDRDAITRRGLDVVRRPTGGRAVWHARELTYAVAAPVGALGGHQESYHRIHRLIAAGLARLGAPVELAPARPAESPGAGACFASAAGGEITAGGRKLVGSAQLRQGGAVLQHGSVLLEDDQSLVTEVARSPETPRRPREATLHGLLGRRVAFDEVAAAIAEVLEDTWGPVTRLGTTPAPLARRAEALGPAFRDPAWTWRR